MKKALILAALSISNLAFAGANVVAPIEGVNPVAVKAWTACAQNFLSSDKPAAYADQIGGMIATLNNVDLNDPKIAKSLAPLAAQLRASSEELLKGDMVVGPDPSLSAKTLKLRALAETPLGALIYQHERWRAEGLYQAYHERLSQEERTGLDEKMRPIAAALGVTAAPRETTGVDASGYVAEVHKNGLAPSGVKLIAAAQAYFKEKGIPVKAVRYNEGYTSYGMSELDGMSWTPGSLVVSFADSDAYRKWNGQLPRKIAGTRIYADSAQSGQAQTHDEVAKEQSLLASAAGHFQMQGIPVSTIRHYEGGLTVSFPDTSVYREHKDNLPKKINDARIYVDGKHVSESDAIDEKARQDALIASAGAILTEKGFRVKAVKYNEGYTSYGMSELDGMSYQPPTLSVTFSDAQNLARWQKRWFHRVAGHSVYADAAPEPGLGFPDPKDHYTAALSAAQAADAQFVAASASLNNKSQNWSYLFLSAQSKELITVITDFLGKAALQGRRPARDLMIHPIDLSKAVSLQTAYDAVKSETFKPVWVNLDRDFHGRVLYRFSTEDGKTQVRVDATTGKIAD